MSLTHTMVRNASDLRQNEMLAAIFDSAEEPLVSLDPNGIISAWNRSAEAALGYLRLEACGQSFALVADEETQANLAQWSTEGKGSVRIPAVLKAKTGSTLSAILQLSALHSPDGRLVGTLIAVKAAPSISFSSGQDLLLLNSELVRSESRFRTLAESLADMLWSLDAKSTYPSFLSERFGRYTGVPREALTEDTWLKLLHPDDRAAARGGWREARAAGQRFQVEFRLRRADGAYRWFLACGMPVLSESGEILQWLGTNTDIDDVRRDAEALRRSNAEALRRSNQELKQFAYAAAHDLQEPLRNVATCIGMLRRHYESRLDSSGMEWIDASIEGAQRLFAMVKDLLTYSTVLEEETRLMEDAQTPLEAALNVALTRLASEVARVGPDLRIHALPAVRVHQAHAIALFHNILSNSLKYSKPDTECVIEISSKCSGNVWTVSVADNGIGFDPVYAERIFGVFKRLHPRNSYPGNGIGLAVCDRIVAHYGGRIWAEAENGKGATFHFTLPGVTGQ